MSYVTLIFQVVAMSSHLYSSKFMQRALELAAERRGFCAPNPAVGAVVVKDGEIIGEGWHVAYGAAHAEVMAIQAAGHSAAGADIYVTLEPCCHYGKTPPCTELLINAQIKRVFYGLHDPNPQVAGKGEQQLRAAGVVCQQVSDATVTQFYQSYCYWWQQRRPWVTVKLALSLDGKIAGQQGKPICITGKACENLTHRWRRRSDAILTTARTVLADDPQLNVRLPHETIAKPIYILDRQLQLSTTIRLLQTSQQLILLHQADVASQRILDWQENGARCVAVPIVDGILDWSSILQLIGADGVHDLWVEAGGRCLHTLWQQHLVQRLLLYVAPKVLGTQALAAFDFEESIQFNAEPHSCTQWQVCGEDVVMVWEREC